MRLMGKRKSDKNPNWCSSCFNFMSTHHGGAEIECTMLFADVRGSTALAERMSPTDFRHLMDRFYTVATDEVVDNDGIVDKFVGDELVAMFFPLLSGDRHASRAVDAARGILAGTGHGDASGPWVPVGAGIHTGPAWVGAVGSGSRTELTALGDAVNTAARLSAAAGVGEVLVSGTSASAAGLSLDLEQRKLELKGKSTLIDVAVLHIGSHTT
jgi:adenylate cyclase